MQRTEKTHKVPKLWFKILALREKKDIRDAMEEVFFFEGNGIKHFEFGKFSNHRVYRIFMKNKSIYEWDVTE
jgi:hypothetical protein